MDNLANSRSAGLQRLQKFLPHAGRAYARGRNHDFGPETRNNVSALSPWIRHRLITEHEVIEQVLSQHSSSAAEKFIQEVCWRTYWKGWLELRPQVWQDFLAERDRCRDELADNAGYQKALSEAEAGSTGIEGFDDWARELIETGYLHNHARMWFASIWIFTLKLPWSLGADFFLRHLLDADPASNTLSWRWVAGLQTRGKTYLARPDNIDKFTDGRFKPTNIAAEAPPLEWVEPPRPQALLSMPRLDQLNDRAALVLIHPEDLHPESLLPANLPIETGLAFASTQEDQHWPFGDKASAFVAGGVEDAVTRASVHFDVAVQTQACLKAESLVQACREADVDRIITAYAPVGPVADSLAALQPALREAGIELCRVRRDWDEFAWPHASKGFFPFKEKIPALLRHTGLE